jgi:hypothetical protein
MNIMKTKILIPVLSFFIILSSAYAQKWNDHPLIGRYGKSEIVHQEKANLNEYTIALQGIKEAKTISETRKLQGRVVMTLYAASDETSSFEIYKAYLDLLKSRNFEILFNCEKIDCRGDVFEHNPTFIFYNLAPFATDPGLNHSYPITQGNPEYTYILTAKGDADHNVTYVSLIAAQGYRKNPYYKLDVVEIEKSTREIVSIKESGPDKKSDRKKISEVPTSPGKNWTKSVEIRVGFGAYTFSDALLSGSNYSFINNQTGTVTGTLAGFGFLGGPYFNIRYYFNENLGISIDVCGSMSDLSDFYTSSMIYNNTIEVWSQKIGFTGQVVGNPFPVRLSATIGAGNSIIYMVREFKETEPGNTHIYLSGKSNALNAFIKFDLSVPLFHRLFMFGNYEYNIIPLSPFKLEEESGSDYSAIYGGGQFGGSHIRFGLGYTF